MYVTGSQICSVSPAGGSATVLPVHAGELSPDGSKVAFVNGGALFVANPDGTGVKQVTDPAIAFTRLTLSPVPSLALQTITPAGTGSRTLFQTFNGIEFPRWVSVVHPGVAPCTTGGGGGGGGGGGRPGGAACAHHLDGTRHANVLVGTAAGDRIRGLRGNDRINGKAGDDCLDGGHDTVFADHLDRIKHGCEHVKRR